MSPAKSRASGIIGGQEFDDEEPFLLVLQVRLETVFVLRTATSPTSPVFRSFCSKLAIHRRYTERRCLCVPYCYLQGITVRPVPCDYYVIPVCQRPFTAVTRVQIPSGTPIIQRAYKN